MRGISFSGKRVMVSHIPHPEEVHHGHHDSDNGHRNDEKYPWSIDVPKHWPKAPVERCEERENEQQERSP